MQYREDKVSGNKLSALGLGCMRFLRNNEEAERVILTAIEGGINYFDTAYLYPNSEVILGSILAKHGKRKDVYIATKLPLTACKNAGDFDKFFNEQLQRLKTDYIDYYLMHNITGCTQWERFRNQGIEQWIAEKKRSGQIRRIGFSYHGTCSDFLKILESYAWEFCMIQYNYYDENYQAGRTGLKAAAEKGISVMVMEPLLGGKLATNLPKQVMDIFSKANPTLTPVDWAFWWLWNQPEVGVVLSGMNSVQQVESNLSSADSYRPLSDDESSVYAEVLEHFRKSYKIPCTGCNYCLPCPLGINIPACFSAYNARYTQGYISGISLYMTTASLVSGNPVSPRSCSGCGRCEEHCPQQIEIRKSFKKVIRCFEPLPMRMLISILRRVLAR